MKTKWIRSPFKSKRAKTNKLLILKISFIICALAISNLISAQQRSVTGTVTDAVSGEPIPGVNIVIEGTTLGLISDANGNYKIEISKPDAVLIFSFIGYLSERVSASGQSVLNIKLSPDIKNLDEVVVVGYGTTKKRDLTGAVTSLQGDQISAIPVANGAQALQGKLSGVNVITQDGRPDADVSIRIRGGGSISQSNDPLFIVDGFPVSDISNIPANQIENMDVLKDASSTAIYGARGANGVIIITTKSGKIGKMKVTYDGYVKFNYPTKYLSAMNAYDYIAYNWAYAESYGDNYGKAWEWLWGIGRSAGTYNNPDGIDHYRNVEAQNYAKQTYGKSFSQSHNLSISGGNENTKYMIGLNNLSDDGMKVNSWYKRTNASLKIDQKLSKKLSFTVDTRFSDVNKVNDDGTTNGSGSILSSAYTFRPIATKDVLGELNDQVNTFLGMFDNVLQDKFNPVARIKDYTPEDRNRSLVANTSLSWNLIKGLTARTDLGLSSYWNKTNKWWGAIARNYVDPAGNETYSGDAEIVSSEGWNMRWANTLTYDIPGLSENNSLNIVAGQEVANSGSEKVTIDGSFYPVGYTSSQAFAMMDQHRASAANTDYFSYSTNTGTPDRMLSYFGRANYSLLNRFLLTATFRADASSRFAPSHRWGYFPAAAIGWRVSEEKFIKNNLSFIDNLKLRFSYGSVGSDNISSSLWNQNWASDGATSWAIGQTRQISYSPAKVSGTSIVALANRNLKWETTITRDLGLDYGFLSNRIYGTVEVYKNSTKDLLVLRDIPPITGFTSTYDNVGSTSNKGLEFSVGGDIIRSSKFKLSINANINFNRSKVEALADGVNGLYSSQWGSTATQPTTGDYLIKVGQPVGVVRGYIYKGWYTVDDFNYANGVYTLKPGVADIGPGIIGNVSGTAALKPGSQVAYPGVMKLKDTDGDGVVNENDVAVIGNMNPKHTGGLNIQGNYRNLDFLLGFNWSYGNQIYNANLLSAYTGGKDAGMYKNRLKDLDNAYQIYDIQDGQLVSVTDPDALNKLNANAKSFLPYQENPVVSSFGIEDGSYLRLNTVTLGYSLPVKLLHVVKITKIRIYATIYNALIWTKYSGLDPEVNTNPNLNHAAYPTLGMDWGTYPRARSFIFGLNLEF